MTTASTNVESFTARHAIIEEAPAFTSPVVLKEDAFIAYEIAVREGKEIVRRMEAGGLRLGELADRVKPKYGEKTLKHLAADIGVAVCTLERHRDTFRAWKEIPAPGRPFGYSVARELATHPDREQIIAENPRLTKRAARRIMRTFKTKTIEGQDVEDLARDLMIAANKARGLIPENFNKEKFAQVASFIGTVQSVRQCAEGWTEIADLLSNAGEEDAAQVPEPS